MSDGIRFTAPSTHVFEVYHAQTVVGVPALDHALILTEDVGTMENRFRAAAQGQGDAKAGDAHDPPAPPRRSPADVISLRNPTAITSRGVSGTPGTPPADAVSAG